MRIDADRVDSLSNLQGFIVIEGVNGAGKTSLIKKISENYQKEHKFLLTREPGAGKLGKALREVLLNNQEKVPELSELLLFAADRANHVSSIIKPALLNKQVVLSDRYYYSTTAFQGYGRGLDLELIKQINTIAIQDLKPDLVILLDLDAEIGLKRNQSADKERDSFEEEELEFHQKIREGFLKQAETLEEKFVIIDASKEPLDVWGEVQNILDCYFENYCAHRATH